MKALKEKHCNNLDFFLSPKLLTPKTVKSNSFILNVPNYYFELLKKWQFFFCKIYTGLEQNNNTSKPTYNLKICGIIQIFSFF